MTQYAIVTDLNLCVGCLACSVACKAANSVPIGNFWEKMLRIGPNPKEGGSGQWPDVEMYFLPVQCQHCANPACVEVCPTEASHKLAEGELPQCVAQCGGRARFFGDIEQGLDSFVGPSDAADGSCSYESLASARVKMGDFVNDFSDSDVYALPNVGNDPSFLFILRDRKWQG